ncbi:MAG: hypothetical protein U0R19_03060 [Bryobacteraceae bacterium]
MATPALALLRNETSCGDEIWIATALLTRERAAEPDHSVEDILARAAQENIHGSARKGLEGYARVHCCANKPPSPSALKMLYATGRNRRRLYRPGDDHHPGRTGRSMPALTDIPDQYHELVEWWLNQLASLPPVEKQPVKSFLKAMEELREASQDTWKGIDADAYVRELREGWE